MSAIFQAILGSFQSPWMLWGLLSVAAPIIIHLLQRRRVVQIPFSTLRFLKAISAKTTRRSRIENLLLLFLRCLIFALLILAAARPVISAKASRYLGGNVPRTVVLMMDNSLSMAYRAGEQTRLELAKRQAMAILDDLKPDDEVAVIAVSDRADNLIAEPTVKHEMARQAVQSLQATEARTDFSAGFREARRIVLKSEKGIRLVFLITDNQETGWRFESKSVFNQDWNSKSPKLIIVRTDELASVNGSVKNIAFRSQFATGGSLVRGVATVENSAAAPLHDLLEIRLGEERVAQRPVDVDANSAVDVQFEFTAPAVLSRALQGYGKLQGDNLPGDDRFYFALPVYKPPRVLVVQAQQGGEERMQSGFFLKKALAVGLDAATAASSVNVISSNELDDKPLEPYSIVFLADLPRFSDRAVVRLNRYLDTGRTVALFVGDQSSIDQLKRLDFLPAKPTKRYDLPANRIATRVTDPNHPLFASAWGSEMPFPPIPQQKMFDWDLAKDARVLILMAGQ
ncbi:MAG: BatA domain-containing protein, partial [Verrucomicrobiia bacterium]